MVITKRRRWISWDCNLDGDVAQYLAVALLKVKNSHMNQKNTPIRFPTGAEFVHNVAVAL